MHHVEKRVDLSSNLCPLLQSMTTTLLLLILLCPLSIHSLHSFKKTSFEFF